LSLWLKQISSGPASTPFVKFSNSWLGYVAAASAIAFCAGVFNAALPWLAAALVPGLIMSLYARHLQAKEFKKFSALHILGESSPQVELIETMTEWFKTSSGPERIAPDLLTLLDSLAETRERASRLLADHKDSAENPVNKQEILATLDLALADAIWMGRHLIRLPRQRKTTFSKRIAEPGFQASALAAVAETLKEAQSLVDSIGEASGRDTALSLRKHLARLEEIHAARKELGPEPEFLEEFNSKTES
jgi:hypothetical protein